jgi:hypothetical protein
LISENGAIIYEGEWKNNKMDGQGIYFWDDGRYYEGYYKNDMKHGYGEYTYTDGQIYMG